MKHLLLFTFFISFIFISFQGIGQTITSAQAGAWNQTATWTGGVIPTAANSTAITVQHNVNIPASYTATVDQVTVNVGNTLTVDASGTLDLQSSGGPDLTLSEDLLVFFIGANLVVNGDFINRSFTALNLGAGLSTTAFGSVSRYEHNINGGTIPNSNITWNTTSTCEITGVTNAVPGGLNQSFGHLIWNSTGTTGNLALGLTSTTINGNLSILDTGPSPGIVTLAGTNGTVDINGDFIVSGSSRFLGTSTSNVTLDIEGDFNFSSTGLLSLLIVQTGTLDFNLGGDFIVSSGTLQAYAVPTTTNVNFDGSVSQTFNSTGGMLNNNFNWTIKNGSTVYTGTSAFVNGGTFTLESGGTMGVGSTDGLVTGTTNGNVRVSGTRTYTASGNIIYNGSAQQNLGNEWDTGGDLNSIAVNLEIDNNNGNGVTNNLILGNNIVGNLTLTNGSFNIGGSNSMDIQSNFIVTNGTIGGSSTSDLTFSESGALGVLSMTSGATQLNNLTISRAGTLVLGDDLTINGALALTGNLNFSSATSLTLTLNGTMTGGGGLISNANSNLNIGGTGAFGIVNFNGTGNQLNNLTLNKTSSGTYTWSSSVTVNTGVNLNFGTLTHSSGLTMAANSTFFKGQGTITTLSPNAVSSYNVQYDAAGNTGLEIPTVASALNDLTLNTGGTVTLQSSTTINGDLILLGGTLDASTNDITMAGNANWTANGGGYTMNSTNAVNFTGTTTLGGSTIDGAQFGNISLTGVMNAPSANINVSGELNNTGTFNAGTGTVTFNGASSAITGGTTTFNNLAISDALTAPAATLNVSGHFFNTGTFNHNNGTVVLNGGSIQIIASGGTSFNNLSLSGAGTKTLASALDVDGDLTLGSGTVLGVGVSNYTINLAGNWINSGGTFNAGTGLVTFDGGTMAINGTGTTSFFNMTTANSSIVSVNGIAELTGTLTLGSSATFDADGTSGGTFTVVSNSSDDARVDVIPSGSVITGNLTFQKYLPSYGSKRWRNITSAVASATVGDLQNEIMISGDFIGNNNIALGLTDPLGPNSIQSMAGYDESLDLGIDDNWVNFPVTTNTETLTLGKGYSIYVRSTGAVTFDLRGTVNQGNISLPVSGTGSTPHNLVGNPYPSSIDWDNGAGWSRSNIQGDAISVWDGTQYLTWNGSIGSLGNGRIPMGMAFWVEASNSSVNLDINENAKTATTGSTHREIPPAYIELELTGINYDYSDKAYIEFVEGSKNEFDINDVSKLPNYIFNLSTVSSDMHELAINSVSNFICGTEIPISITNLWIDNYRLDWSNLASIDDNIQISLLDKSDSSIYDLRTFTGAIIVNVTAESDIYDTLGTEPNTYYTYEIKDRFVLIFNEAGFSIDLPTVGAQVCTESLAAQIIIGGSELGVNYGVYQDGLFLENVLGDGSDLEIYLEGEYLQEGENNFSVKASRGECEMQEFTNPISISLVDVPVIEYDVKTNELITNAFGKLQWYKNSQPIDGATSNSIIINDNISAEYYVVTSNEICEKQSEPLTITSLEENMTNLGIDIYPNPIKNIFTIKLSESNFENVSLRVFSNNGLLIEERKLINQMTTIDAANYDSGVYIIEILDAGSRFVTRVVKN